MEAWFRHLACRPLKQSTRRNAIIKVRVFLETIQDERWAEAPRVPLFRRGDLPPEDRYLPRPLSPAVDRALREELRRQGGLIPKALLLTRATGLRTQEILDLEVNSLSRLSGGQWSLRVPLGKLHSERVIPVGSDAAGLFDEIRELRGSPEDEASARFLLIRRSNGRRYTREALRHALKAAEKRAKLPEHPTPHRLRHTYATELLRAGIRLPALMKLLGHRTIGMTLRYAALTGFDVQRAYEETVDIIKKRYDFGSIRPKRGRTATSSRRRSMRERLDDVAAELEKVRRDHVSGERKRRVQRLVERLRRLADDVDAATS
jgi:site-specific recombinase XerD